MYKNGGGFYIFIYALVFLGFIGSMIIIFNQIVENYYEPVLNDSSLNFSQEDITQAHKFEGAWNMMPIYFVILIFTFIIYKIYVR